MAQEPTRQASDSAQLLDQTIACGQGGETHQTASADTPTLTTQQGIPVADDQNSLKPGPRGPTLLEDSWKFAATYGCGRGRRGSSGCEGLSADGKTGLAPVRSWLRLTMAW